ncbi:MAG: phospholipase A [Candidatus Zixiibacteriota bacterium]
MNKSYYYLVGGLFFLILLILAQPLLAGQKFADFQRIHSGSGLTLHKEMFLLPFTYSSEYDNQQIEAVFQVSAKHRIFGTRLYFAYTQISFWQAYDSENSAPFRETNYNPELFYRFKPFKYEGGRIGADLGFEHESNGQIPPVSRSWNLFYLCPYYQKANFLIYFKFRYRVPEESKKTPDDPEGDDNPDITDFYGYNDINLYYKLPHNNSVHIKGYGNIATGKGGFFAMYSIPIPKSENSFFTIRISHGFGESLVDYNKSLSRVGIGISFMQ